MRRRTVNGVNHIFLFVLPSVAAAVTAFRNLLFFDVYRFESFVRSFVAKI